MSLISPIAPKTKPRESANPQTRLDSLTGLRWCAALLIFCYHFAYEESASGTARHMGKLKDLTLAGPSAVSFFFILSGFVLAWSARRGDTVTGFWRRRFARIYPSHAVTFCVAVVMLIWMGQKLDPAIALSNLTLTQAYVPNRTDVWFGYNGVSWSLSCEFFFYFTFPFIIPLIRRFSKRLLWATVVLGNLFVVAYPAFTQNIKHATGWDAKFFLYMLPPMRLMEFVIGIALALLVKQGAWRGPGMVVSVALSCAAVFGLARVVPYDFHWSATTVIPYTLTIAAAARADVKGDPSPFRNQYIVYLGEVSFAFYLVHEMVIFSSNYFFQQHHFVLPLTLHAGLVVSVSLLGAVLLHEYVEKPGVKLLSRKKKPKPVTIAA
ncbi:acyltransferase [Streptomyces sp. NPDC049577]|uniref:acyltransferase family protein n=1 Tax=Streptomyces sp. NPDC049577 TaxID=3155153 RepID=UPI00343FB00C